MATTQPAHRPRVYDDERRQIQTRFTVGTIARIEAEAERRRVSKNYIIETLVLEGLDLWERQKI